MAKPVMNKRQVDTTVRNLFLFSAKILDKQFRHKAFQAFTRIVENTPVDTGRAATSWNVTKNKPNFSVKPESSTGEESYTGNSFNIKRLTKNDKVYIANGLDYVKFLDQGSSRRSGRFFIQKALREVGLR